MDNRRGGFAGNKRSGPPYGGQNHHANKKHRPNTQPPVQATSRSFPNGSGHSQQPRNGPPGAGALSREDMESGLVALLDRFVDEETTPSGDREILFHARELRRRLCKRTSSTKRELEQKRPFTGDKAAIPPYVDRMVVASKKLPPLPPIAEPSLHQAVFTHRSYNSDPTLKKEIDLSLDYERLELVGDAYIELIATRALYHRFPHVDVPSLSSWRERLVENAFLCTISQAYGFPDRLKSVNVKFEGKSWQKIEADMVEAYIAALVLSDPENGFETAEEWLTALWADKLLGFKETIVQNPLARDQLNVKIHVRGVEVKYKEEKPMRHHPQTHQQIYSMGVYLTGWGYEDEWLGSGEAQSKAQANVAAASDAMSRNSKVLQDATRQKAELVEARKKEQAKADGK